MVQELDEKDFIQEDFHKDKRPMWFFLILLSLVIVGYSLVRQSQDRLQQRLLEDRLFFNVTNRELSVFLWQNPELMRGNVQSRSNYLPAFEYLGDVTVNPNRADEKVIGPRELLYRYHQWARLLGDKVFDRKIPHKYLMEFLEEDAQWKPEYWKGAPKEYAQAYAQGLLEKVDLPLKLRQAFHGWFAYKYEGVAINQIVPTAKELRAFLKEQPEYARHNWYFIYKELGMNYLGSLQELEGVYPLREISPQLRWAYHTATTDVISTKPSS